MKKQVLLIIVALMPFSGLYASSISVSGTISSDSTWTGVDTVKVTGDIVVDDGVTLTIDPGILVEFQGHYNLNIRGRLLAIGTETDTIVFTAANPSTGWNRITFNVWPGNDTSKVVYCKLEYGKANTGGSGDQGGAIAVYYWNKVKVSHCLFENNFSNGMGGALHISQSHIFVKYCIFKSNLAFGAGIVNIRYCSPHLINNLIVDNPSTDGLTLINSGCHIINNTIKGNDVGLKCSGNSDPEIKNTIIYGNQSSEVYLLDNDCDPDFYYCDVQGGTGGFDGSGSGSNYSGDYINCLDADPQFIGSGDNPLDLSASSPCINAGDPATTIADAGEYDFAGDPRFLNGRIDIGAYESPSSGNDDFPGTALEFDGIDDYVSVPSDASLNTPQFTVEFWVKMNNPGNWQGIIDKGRNSNTDWYFLTGNPGQTEGVMFGIGNGTARKAIRYSWNDSLWHHVAGTYDGTTLKLFVDGQMRGSDTYSYSNTSNNIVFGSRRNQSWAFEGKIDEITIWSDARTIQEIRENMYLPFTGSETGIVSYWQLNEGAYNIATDVINGNHGQLYNMTDDDWIESTIPFGGGASNSQIVNTTGIVDFTGTRLSTNFTAKAGTDTIVATRIDTVPNINPGEAYIVFDEQYWIVNQFGSGTFETDLTFTLVENLPTACANDPSIIKLYTRSSNADTNWAFLTSATSVDTANDKVTFEGITSFSQFIIGRIFWPDIDVDTDSLNYGSLLVSVSQTDSIIIYNNGCDTLSVSDISNNNTDYSPDITNCSIPPGDSCDVKITFTPSAVGIITDTLTITSNDPDEPATAVVLTGKGIKADNYPGTALEFDGLDDYVSIAHNKGLPIYRYYCADNRFTISIWVKGDAQDDKKVYAESDKDFYQDLFSIGTTNEGKVKVFIRNIHGNSILDQVSTNIAFDNTWHHIAWVDINNDQKLYIDGVQDPANFTYLRWGIQLSRTSIGAISGDNPSNFFEGVIDELQLWDDDLSENQIRENMHLTLIGNETGLLSYWQMNENSGNTIYDLVSGNNGTLIGMDTINSWVESTVATGGGVSNTQTETAGTVDFTGTGLSMYYNSQNGASVTSTRIDTTPNIGAAGLLTNFDSQYWVVNRFGTGSFNADITFTVNEDLTIEDQSNPDTIALFKRNSNSDEEWSFVKTADYVDHLNDEARFTGITEFSQFIIGRGPIQNISLKPVFIDFGYVLKTDTVTDTLSAINSGGDTLTISNIFNANSDYSIDTTNGVLPPGDTLVVQVIFTPSVLGEILDTLSIISDDPDEPTAKVPIRAFSHLIDTVPGTALYFDGENDYVNIGHGDIGNPVADFTIEVWAMLDSIPSENADIISKHAPDTGIIKTGYALEYNPANGITALMGDSSGWKIVTGATWNIDEWHHVTLTYDSIVAELKLYDNGVLQGTETVTVPLFDTNDLRFAASQRYGNYFQGKIDEVRFWNIALDSAQIRENMHRTLTGNETGLINYWQFNAGTGTTAYDFVGRVDATLTNMQNEDWITSTAPLPFVTAGDGFWGTDASWLSGQNAPVHPWVRVRIEHHIAIFSSVEVIELNVIDTGNFWIITGNTLTVSGD